MISRSRRPTGGLGDVRNRCAGGELQRLGLGDVLDEHGVGRFSHRPDHLFVPGMADQDDRVAVGGVPARLDVNLGHERAGRVDHVVAARVGGGADGGRDTVRREDDQSPPAAPLPPTRRRPHRASSSRTTWDVVHDLLADVDGWPVVLERQLDRLDRAFDSRRSSRGVRREARVRPSRGS